MANQNQGNPQDSAQEELVQETRWSKVFATSDGKQRRVLCHFPSGAGEITAQQIASEWPTWSEVEQKEFCMAIGAFRGPERDNILRFLLREVDFRLLRNAAMVFTDLPHSETVPWLISCVERSELGEGMNFLQALAWTASPLSVQVIQKRLSRCMGDSALMLDDAFMNWVAAESIYCTRFLIDLRSDVRPWREQVSRFGVHPCRRVRELYEWQLAPYLSSQD